MNPSMNACIIGNPREIAFETLGVNGSFHFFLCGFSLGGITTIVDLIADTSLQSTNYPIRQCRRDDIYGGNC